LFLLKKNDKFKQSIISIYFLIVVRKANMAAADDNDNLEYLFTRRWITAHGTTTTGCSDLPKRVVVVRKESVRSLLVKICLTESNSDKKLSNLRSIAKLISNDDEYYKIVTGINERVDWTRVE
jgi:hypothetical protein